MFERPRASVAFVLVTRGLDALGIGIIAPIVPCLVRALGHLSPEGAAPWAGALVIFYAVVQFLATPLLSELSDRFGRCPVILASVCLIAGATSANVAAATAYMSDVSQERDRPRLFGLVGATFGAGFVIGPALGGLLGSLDLQLPLAAAAALSFANVCFGLFVLPESLTAKDRRGLTAARAKPFQLLVGISRDGSVLRLAVAWPCTRIRLGAVQSCLVLFTGYRLGWGPGLNGLVLAGIALSQAWWRASSCTGSTRSSARAGRPSPATRAARLDTACWRSRRRDGRWSRPWL